MNSQIKKILLIYVLSTFCILYAQENSTTLIIETNRDDAGLFFDDKFFGTGNQFNLDVESGLHTIYISENIRDWDAEIIKDTVQVSKSDNLNLQYNFKSKDIVNTVPQDVYVYEKDSLMGFTPALIETGFLKLKLEKPDYSSLSVSAEEINSGIKPKLKYIGKPPKDQFYGSTLFTVLLGTAIALGAATAYYKIEADNLYDEYLITGDQGLLDNINQYDGQSAGTLIAMELCVGAIIYFFLTE
jgi:hypothetical protein